MHTDVSAQARAIVSAPTRRDREVAGDLLRGAGIDCLPCKDPPSVVSALEEGAGVLVATERLFDSDGADALREWFAAQPPWSDLPVVVLAAQGHAISGSRPLLPGINNLTLLERPTSSRTLVSTVQAALRSRARQYQTRDQLIALHSAEEELRAADRRKNEFLAMLAHELRNPLAPIRSAAEVLAVRCAPDAGAHDPLAVIGRQLSTMARLVDDLLDVARISGGQIALQREPIALQWVVRNALEVVAPLIDAKGQTLVVPAGEPVTLVHGDEARLVQTVANLVHNASKFTPTAGRIELGIEVDGRWAVLSVSDDGIGISEGLLPHVFDLFVQGDRALDRAEGGLGVGLSLVQQVVNLHGGTVEAFSAGAGARFVIRLPLLEPASVAVADRPAVVQTRDPPADGDKTGVAHREAAGRTDRTVARAGLTLPRWASVAGTGAESEPAAGAGDPVSRGAAADPGQARAITSIVVVDDNMDAADALTMRLEMAGYEATPVYGANEALDLVDRRCPDAFVLDIGLPVMDGFEVARRIRADHADVVLVALSGYGRPEDFAMAAQAGFDTYLVKPVAFEALSTALRNAAAGRRA